MRSHFRLHILDFAGSTPCVFGAEWNKPWKHLSLARCVGTVYWDRERNSQCTPMQVDKLDIATLVFLEWVILGSNGHFLSWVNYTIHGDYLLYSYSDSLVIFLVIPSHDGSSLRTSINSNKTAGFESMFLFTQSNSLDAIFFSVP